MATRNGIEAARTIWKERPETRSLFWSNYSDEAYVRGVSRIVPDGAAYGYVLKSASDERLKLALRSIFVESQCVIDREIRGVQQKSLGQSNGFTDSEYEILIDIAPQCTEPLAAALRQARRLPVDRRGQRGRPVQPAHPRRHHRAPAQTLELQCAGKGRSRPPGMAVGCLKHVAKCAAVFATTACEKSKA
jgi:hypothetical protein